MSDHRPHADASVRLGWADDAPQMARVQLADWQQTYADLLPTAVLHELSADRFEEGWRASLVRPADARQRVLVALERADLRGFVATAPCEDDDADTVADGQIAELVVDPAHRREGHGSRLVHAAVDTLRSDGFTRATVWVPTTADTVRAFLGDQGFAPDGAHRSLDLHGDGAVVVKHVRLHTDLTQE